jgi:hypothetical protein
MRRQMKLILSIALAAALLSLSGCYWMGKTTGKAVQKVEEGQQSFEHGYNKARNDPPPPPPRVTNQRPSSSPQKVQPKSAGEVKPEQPQPQPPAQLAP